MRIWSIHPKYLDAKGLVTLWREALLAKNVLLKNTKGYTHHPQLIRFKESPDPIKSINYYLQIVWQEANKRSYQFDPTKFVTVRDIENIFVTSKQIGFERSHFLKKLYLRDRKKYTELSVCTAFDAHPLFSIIEGEIEPWEKTPSPF